MNGIQRTPAPKYVGGAFVTFGLPKTFKTFVEANLEPPPRGSAKSRPHDETAPAVRRSICMLPVCF